MKEATALNWYRHLVSTNAAVIENDVNKILALEDAAKSNRNSLSKTLSVFIQDIKSIPLSPNDWEKSIYKPTPTIIEAARALYNGHKVEEISRSDSGAINLSKTAQYLNDIINNSKTSNTKSICFVTGVPGAGKTLAGLNIANERMKSHEDEHAVFLSGNGPLVDVLREALTRDIVSSSRQHGSSIKKNDAKRKTHAFIQNIHHFRDEYLKQNIQPTEKVVVFDEAQRAWTNKQASSFMKRKKGIENFNMSEPEFLIDVMNRHTGWCTIVCLIGGGQEINTGEAGLEEWIETLKNHYSNWHIHYSNLIINTPNYIKSSEQREWLTHNATKAKELHLAVSVRSFRSEKLSAFIHNLLELRVEDAKELYKGLKSQFPIKITRDMELAKSWLREKAKGSERTGIIASSGARRLKSVGLDVKNEISAPIWFLNGKEDVRSSYFLEEIATEFDIQGLEIDWVCLAWGANFHIENNKWRHQIFKGSKWVNMKQSIDQEYLKNTYRVLLTRARQGMVIYLPNGSCIDNTRPDRFYEHTYKYLLELGIDELM